MEYVSNSLVTHTHTGGLVEVHLQCSGSLLALEMCYLPDVPVAIAVVHNNCFGLDVVHDPRWFGIECIFETPH